MARVDRRSVMVSASVIGSALVLGRHAGAQEATPGPGGTPDASAGLIDGLSGPAGDQVRWLIDAATRVAAGMQITPSEIEDHFDPIALAALPADDWAAALGQISGLVVDIAQPAGTFGRPADHFVNLIYDGVDGNRAQLSVQVMPVDPYGIILLSLTPQPANPRPFVNLSEIDAALDGSGTTVAASVAELRDGELIPLHGLNAESHLALGSTFKLWVLAALADAVQAGTLYATSPITIEDEWRSFPSGIMQELPTGSDVPARTMAEHMIAISDNTATDHLIATLGREAIEGLLPDLGVIDPSRSIPMLTTGDLFRFRLLAPDGLAADYHDAGVEERREILADLADEDLASVTPEQIAAWTSAREIDEVEWYATTHDLVRTMAALAARDQAAGDGLIPGVLSIQPGVAYDSDLIREIWFKGGSEPGVLTLAFLVHRRDGRMFAIAIGANDTEGEVDAAAVVGAAGRAVATVAGMVE